jgi:hypothetical protein
LAEECAVSFENLNATIRAVSHIDATLTIRGNAVRGVELAGLVTFVAPVEEELTLG